MLRNIKILMIALMAALIFLGCSMQTPDEMYAIPKRSDDYNNLQESIDSAMTNLEYCAPVAGENRQPVQMADLDGDGTEEYLVFAKGSEEKPLRMMLFREISGQYIHVETIASSGTAFDQVEYVQLDENAGLEILVGSQVSDQVSRSLSVYTAKQDKLEQVVAESYTRMLPVDLNNDNRSEILLVKPSETQTGNGIVISYAFSNGMAERSNEADMSQPAERIRRIVVGKLQGGGNAVYIGSNVDETTLITDVFALREGLLTNVTLSAESGTSIQTMRNYYIYADDIDDDGVVELPALISMKPISALSNGDQQHLIRWYALTTDGREVDKMYTFHNFQDGWYLQLEKETAPFLGADILGNVYTFFMWDKTYSKAEELLVITMHPGQNRPAETDSFVLARTDALTYMAKLSTGAEKHGFTQDSVIYNFRQIQKDWKTGET